jgi:hypothetical protein
LCEWCANSAAFHAGQRLLEADGRACQVAAGGRDVRVPEEIADVVLFGAGLEQPARELAAEIVKAQPDDLRASARGVPGRLARRDLLAACVAERAALSARILSVCSGEAGNPVPAW